MVKFVRPYLPCSIAYQSASFLMFPAFEGLHDNIKFVIIGCPVTME